MSIATAHFVLEIFGDASLIFLFLSPIITFKRIIVNKSTQKFSVIPYIMTIINCVLSAWDDGRIVLLSPYRKLVTLINVLGGLIELTYVLIFLFFAPKKEKTKVYCLMAFVITVLAAVVCISLFVLNGDSRDNFYGSATAIISIIMYASPLSIMRLVIKSKSVEFMPFFLSLFVFLCGTSWFMRGLLEHDLFVTVPNGVGSVLGTIQLILYSTYRINQGEQRTHQIEDLEENNTL